MNKLILGCDAHRHYSVFVGLREDSLAESSNIANESTGHWYCLVDEMEAGHHPHPTPAPHRQAQDGPHVLRLTPSTRQRTGDPPSRTEHAENLEQKIRAVIAPDPVVKRLRSAPGIGEILGPVIALEIGDITRFPRAEKLAG